MTVACYVCIIMAGFIKGYAEVISRKLCLGLRIVEKCVVFEGGRQRGDCLLLYQL